MIAIVDYGVGNLFSLKSSFAYIGEEAIVTREQQRIAACDRIILPGVGAFGDAVQKLRGTGLDQVVIEEAQKGKPLLGICLGMQLLFDKSLEYGEYAGLGLIPGEIVPMRGVVPDTYKVPQIGWNALCFPKDRPRSPLYKNIQEGDHVYFVHSYYAAKCDSWSSAWTEYGTLITASAENKNVFGTQFHPEKSGPVGLNILKAFCEI